MSDVMGDEPEECPKCHSQWRAIEHLQDGTWGCYDCGKTFNPVEILCDVKNARTVKT